MQKRSDYCLLEVLWHVAIVDAIDTRDGDPGGDCHCDHWVSPTNLIPHHSHLFLVATATAFAFAIFYAQPRDGISQWAQFVNARGTGKEGISTL